MTKTEAEKLVNKFETAAIDHEDLGTIPLTSDCPLEQRDINRERRIRKENYTRHRNRLLKALMKGEAA